MRRVPGATPAETTTPSHHQGQWLQTPCCDRDTNGKTGNGLESGTLQCTFWLCCPVAANYSLITPCSTQPELSAIAQCRLTTPLGTS